MIRSKTLILLLCATFLSVAIAGAQTRELDDSNALSACQSQVAQLNETLLKIQSVQPEPEYSTIYCRDSQGPINDLLGRLPDAAVSAPTIFMAGTSIRVCVTIRLKESLYRHYYQKLL